MACELGCVYVGLCSVLAVCCWKNELAMRKKQFTCEVFLRSPQPVKGLHVDSTFGQLHGLPIPFHFS